MKLRFLLLSQLVTFYLYGQNVDIQPAISPDFFTPEDVITIEYDVTGTSLSSLSDAWIWLWLPDNNNADVNSNVNPASSDPSATDLAKFTKSVVEGRTLFTLSLTLSEFTNLPAAEISKVGVLLKGNDWSNGQTSDYVFEISTGFTLKVDSPAGNFKFYNPGATITITASTPEAATFSLTHDSELIVTEEGSTGFSYEFAIVEDGSVHELVLKATNGTETDVFSHSYTTSPIVEELPLPDGVVNGANYIDDVSATLVLTAPNKDNVFVLGDFNDWKLDQDYLMKREGDKFWVTIEGLTPGKEYVYQYLIDGQIQIADPYTEKVISSFDDPQIREENRYPGLIDFPDKAYQEAAVLQTAKEEYPWTDEDFVKPDKDDLVIYELLVRDFSEDRTFRAVIDKLDYLDSLGVNAIELLPVNEFEGNLSWGYNPSFKFAVDKFYGTEEDFKELVDKAHGRGIAIIMDMVLNHHFGRSPLVKMYASGDFGPPTSDNPWFNVAPKHDYNVGYDFNHESPYTREYLDQVVTYWTEEYHVDGYRFDLSKGFTQKNTLGNVGAWGQYDASRIAILKRMADVIWAQNPETYVILEHLSENNEEQELADYGMMLWGNMNHTFRTVAKGFPSDIGWLYHGARSFSEPHVVGYMESHDEERVYWDMGKSSDKSLEYDMNRLKLNAAFFFLVPGPKMVWQFGEYGYDEELNNDRLGIKPTHWEYLEEHERVRLFSTYQALINLKTQTQLLDDEYFSWSSAESIKWINYEGGDVNFSVYGNFNDEPRSGDPHFTDSGIWYNYLTGEEIEVIDPNAEVTLDPGEFYIYTSTPIDNYISIDPVDFITALKDYTSDVRISPNPTNDRIHINGKLLNEVHVYSLSGQLILKKDFRNQSEQIIELSPVPFGVYLLQMNTGNGVITQKVIKH